MPTPDHIRIHKLQNKNGMTVVLSNYGARVLSIVVKDKYYRNTDVALGYDSIIGYLESNDPYFGATVGRFVNRISMGKFALEGKEYQLSKNDAFGPNHVHGGEKGFSHVVWNVESSDSNSIEYQYLSNDMEEGFPGNLNVIVRYRLSEDNSLVIDYKATTDASTICNLSNHTYFNLNGTRSDDILDHKLFINAAEYTPVNDQLLPFGKNVAVKNTPFDFNSLSAIGSEINSSHEQIRVGKGYCHNYVLNKLEDSPAAIAISPESGIRMDFFTTEPGVQLYTCGFMNGSDKGKENNIYGKNSGFCLEAQHFPDSPNQPAFPSTLLLPGDKYTQTTVYKFSVDNSY